MPLTLAIDNATSLPDGGPLSVTVQGKRGLDIGRDAHLDWTLPDPSRFISSKHCEVRWHDGAYWLHDVSTNGTILNGAGGRMTGPHRLRDRDRLEIGPYLISVRLTEESGAAAFPAPSFAPEASSGAPRYWDDSDAPPPIDPRELRAPPERQQHSDFLDWALDAPPPLPGFAPPPAASRSFGSPWDEAPPPAAPVPRPEPTRPTPSSQPAWTDDWEGPPAASQAPGEALAELPDEPPPADDPAPLRLPRVDEPLAAVPEPPRERARDAEWLVRFARGAGLPDATFTDQDAGAFAERLGRVMALVAGDLKQLLEARAMAKRATRSSQHTTIQALDNNPLKFSPTPEQALKIMLGPPSRSYLDAERALGETFADLKDHQLLTLAATQKAIQALVADLAPDAVEASVEPDRGLSGMLASRKARLWDVYRARWDAKAGPHDDGLLGAFMVYFADQYDRSGSA